jgi:hypothetical protein
VGAERICCLHYSARQPLTLMAAFTQSKPTDKRAQGVRNDTLSTMKAFFSIMLGFAVAVSSVEAGPVRTARNVAKSTAITAKNVAHSVVKGTRRAVHTVVYTLTP